MNPFRRPLIAGNWKMNAGGADACPLADEVAAVAEGARRVQVVVAPPFTALAAVAQELAEAQSSVGIAGQNMHFAASGAFIWYQQHKVKLAERHVEQLAQIYKDIGTGNTAKVPSQLDDLSHSSSKAVRATALFTRAAFALQQNDQKLALATYKKLAEDSSLPDAYRNAALIRHGLPDVGLSVITVLGLQVAGIIVGAVVIEQLFTLPGIGRMLVSDVGARDLPMVQGELLVLTGFVLIVGFVVDLVHRIVDPRQREAAS